jgi:hypothetical protein
VSSCWPYAHDKFEDEIFTEGAQDWEEVLQRKSNPNMTRFKSMTMDEQVETIEQTTQESLRVREENRVVEATEAQRRGMLLLEEAQRVIQRLENDPQLNPLIEPIRVTLTDTINLREEINGSESTPLEETAHPENPGIMSQQARLFIVATTQLGETRTSSGTDVPDVLIDLITIYDDEESSGVSLITPVPIMEEGEPRRNICSNSEALTSIPQEGNDQAGSMLDTEFLDQLGIQHKMDNSKEELGSVEQEEETQ